MALFIVLIAAYFSYGPCQTPTLGFCVQRYLQINTFKPEKFWSVNPYIVHSGYEIQLEWQRSKLFDINVNISISYYCCFFVSNLQKTSIWYFHAIAGCYDVSKAGCRGWTFGSDRNIRKTRNQKSPCWSKHSESSKG